jgi:hypothetical protein
MTLDEAIKHARDKAEESREYIVDDCNLEPFEAHCNSQCIKCAEEHEQLAEWLEELKEYKELEEQGLLLKPPCKVGDIVYEIAYIYDEYEILKMRVQDISSNKRDVYLYVVNTDEDSDYNNSISITEFGIDLFLTKEEAEQELKRMECAE